MAAPARDLPAVATARESRPRRGPRDVPRFLLLCLLALIFLAPMYWMVATSLKAETDVIATPTQWLPVRPTLDNYREVFTSPDGNILRWMWNSFFVATAFTVLHVALCALTAYPLARMQFKGRDTIFWIILGSMMIPWVVSLIPTYLMMLRFNWINSFHSLIWPGLAGAFGVFLLRQFFMALPKELEEAARLDGATPAQIFWYVALPMSRPILATLATFFFLANWNAYLWPLIVTQKPEMRVTQVALAAFSGEHSTEWQLIMAGATVAALPGLLLYLFLQRYLVEGIKLSGLK